METSVRLHAAVSFRPKKKTAEIFKEILFSLLNRLRQIPMLLFRWKNLILVSSCAPG
jgi:hypothetical protein